MPRQRLDRLLVQRSLAETRERAQRVIRSGRVRVGEQVESKPGKLFPEDVEIRVEAGDRFVSRGGEKLEAALDRFAIDVTGRVAADAGASTGGFTDCLLQRGAIRVYAIDVGHGQLHWNLRNDPRVVVMERFNARELTPEALPGPVTIAVADVSFISLEKILPGLAAVTAPGADLVTLVKPQFEAGRAQVRKGGVVRDPAVHQAVLERIRSAGETTLPLRWIDVCESPIRGPAGNIEFLAWWKRQ